MKKFILPIIVVLLLVWLVFNKVQYYSLSDQFRATQDSLVNAVDSLKVEIAKDDSTILVLNELDADLQEKLDEQKDKVKTIVKYVEVEKNKVDNYTEQELISAFYKRYPIDTVTNPLPVAPPYTTICIYSTFVEEWAALGEGGTPLTTLKN